MAKSVVGGSAGERRRSTLFLGAFQETTDLPPRPAYLDATVQYSQRVALNGGGTLENYQAGMPFPLFDPADPLLILTYNPAGVFVRLTINAHATPSAYPGNNGVSLPMLVGGTWINYTKDRATLFTTDDSMIYDPPLAAQRFELMEILRRGK